MKAHVEQTTRTVIAAARRREGEESNSVATKFQSIHLVHDTTTPMPSTTITKTPERLLYPDIFY